MGKTIPLRPEVKAEIVRLLKESTLTQTEIARRVGSAQRTISDISAKVLGRKKPRVLHGRSQTAEYRIWHGIMQRCMNPKTESYRNYGARGIRICEEWQKSFEAFIAHVGNRPSPRHSIDRINNEGHYEPGNVRWATSAEQRANTRRNRPVEHGGKRLTVGEWAREVGMHPRTLRDRLKRGWEFGRAISAPLDERCWHHDRTLSQGLS